MRKKHAYYMPNPSHPPCVYLREVADFSENIRDI